MNTYENQRKSATKSIYGEFTVVGNRN